MSAPTANSFFFFFFFSFFFFLLQFSKHFDSGVTVTCRPAPTVTGIGRDADGRARAAGNMK